MDLDAPHRFRPSPLQSLRESARHEIIQRVTADQVKTTCLVVIATLSVGVMVVYLKSILVPFILAFGLSNLVLPVVRFFSTSPFVCVPASGRLRWLRAVAVPWGLSIFLMLCLAILCVWFVASLVASSIESFASKWESAGYEDSAMALFNQTMGWAESLGFDASRLVDGSDSLVQTTVLEAAESLLALSTDFFTIILFAVYLLLGATRHPDHHTPNHNGLQSQIMEKVSVYVRCKILVSVVTAVLTTVSLAALGVDLAVVFGVLTFVLNFIPNFGSLIALLLPLPVVLLSPMLPTTARILAVLLPSIVQLTMGMCVEPLLLGKQLNQSAIFVLLSLMFWGSLWGLVGLFLAVPLTCVLVIVLEEVSEKNDSRLLKDLLALAANDDRADQK